MKNFVGISILLACLGCSAEGPYEEATKRQEQIKNLTHSLSVGHCFRYVNKIKPEFIFEKSYDWDEPVKVVLFVSKKALLIAQPNPECNETSVNSANCEYWFRSMSTEDSFLVHPKDKIVPCPPGISAESLFSRLKSSKKAKRFNIPVIEGAYND